MAAIKSAKIVGKYFNVQVEIGDDGKPSLTTEISDVETKVDTLHQYFDEMRSDLYSIQSHVDSILSSNKFEGGE